MSGDAGSSAFANTICKFFVASGDDEKGTEVSQLLARDNRALDLLKTGIAG